MRTKTYQNCNADQYSTSNWKGILNKCKLFSGWANHDTSDGWLQSFQSRNRNGPKYDPLAKNGITNIKFFGTTVSRLKICWFAY